MISAWKRYAFYIALSLVVLGGMELARGDTTTQTLASLPCQVATF